MRGGKQLVGRLVREPRRRADELRKLKALHLRPEFLEINGIPEAAEALAANGGVLRKAQQTVVK